MRTRSFGVNLSFILLILLSVSLFGCSNDKDTDSGAIDERLIGTWKYDKPNWDIVERWSYFYLVFDRKPNVYVLHVTLDGTKGYSAYEYSIVDTFVVFKGTYRSYHFENSGQTLLLTSEPNEAFSLTRSDDFTTAQEWMAME